MQVKQFKPGNDPVSILSERIKDELLSSLKKSGIHVSSIIIDMEDEILNVKVNMSKEEDRINLL
jgi:L-rhamnose mutarotase